MSRNMFKSILTFLHVSNPDPTTEAPNDQLCKVRILLDKLNANCQAYYFPQKYASIDERMVKNKGRFSMCQYIRNKPTKWGFKLWVLCDSMNGYTYKFSAYRGKEGEIVSSHESKVSPSCVVKYYRSSYLRTGVRVWQGTTRDG